MRTDRRKERRVRFQDKFVNSLTLHKNELKIGESTRFGLMLNGNETEVYHRTCRSNDFNSPKAQNCFVISQARV
jgi:hypothetical protein